MVKFLQPDSSWIIVEGKYHGKAIATKIASCKCMRICTAACVGKMEKVSQTYMTENPPISFREDSQRRFSVHLRIKLFLG